MRWPIVALVLLCAVAVRAEPPSTQPAVRQAIAKRKPYSNGARQLARNYIRPGWRLVDGMWAKPQAKFPLVDLVRLVEENGRHAIVAQPSARVEPMLKNWRTSLIEIAESDFAWKLSSAGRLWNDTHSAGTQHLQLIAVLDDASADQTYRLTKLEVTPTQQVVQAVIAEDNEPLSVIIVFGQDFTEATISKFNAKQPRVLMRSATARKLMVDHPIETRNYVVPALRLLNHGVNPLAPAAGDVYRAFTGLPVDDELSQTIVKLAPDLASREPSIRDRASRELASLSRRGVQAAMQLDATKLPLEAADRIAAFVQQNTLDERDPAALRADSGFLLDCLTDPDPNVKAAAGKLVSHRGSVAPD